MSGPLSGEERRNDWVVAADQERKSLEAAQKMRHQEEQHALKMKGMAAKYGVEPPPRVEPKVGTRSPLPGARAPMAAASAVPTPQATDVQPAMLTPGEAVIPAPAAQDPKNQGIIARMVSEGREANKALQGLMQHFTGTAVPEAIRDTAPGVIRNRAQHINKAVAGYADGETAVPFPLARRC